MSRTIDFDKPLSEVERKYLSDLGRDWQVHMNDERFSRLPKREEELPKRDEAGFVVGGPPVKAAQPNWEPDSGVVSGIQVQAAETVGDVDPESDDEDDELEDWVYSLTASELRAELTTRGKDTSGRKSELQDRLLAALEEEEPEVDSGS